MALATMTVLRRNVVPLSVVEPWVARIAAGAELAHDGDGDPFRRHRPTPRPSCGPCTSSSPSLPVPPGDPARPAAGPGRRAALDQPVVPDLT